MKDIFFESIKIERNLPLNLKYHLKRIVDTFSKYGDSPTKNPTEKNNVFSTQINPLKSEIENIILNSPTIELDQVYKLKVIYNINKTSINIINSEITPYKIKNISSLKLIHADDITYGSKSMNRDHLDTLFNMRGECDDILIVKDGSITDSSYANIIFSDGSCWFTPDTPLLKGTKRGFLIDNHLIKEAAIKAKDLNLFKSFKLINALRDPADCAEIEISKIL